MKHRALFLPLLSALLLTAVLPAAAADARFPVRFLTGPNDGEPLEIALAYVHEHRAELGLTEADLADLVVRDKYLTRHNGTTHIYLRQRLDGIEVYNGDININIGRDGQVINLGNGFVRDLASAANARAPQLPAGDAVRRAAEHLDLRPTGPLQVLEHDGGPMARTRFGGAGLSEDPIPAQLMYLPRPDGSARLVWDLVMRLGDGEHWWNLRVDAVDGKMLDKNNWVASDSYRVFAQPLASPGDPGATRTLETDPADAMASPFGWHDTNGAAGAEFTDTRGNNVTVQEDQDANNFGGARPSGGGGLDFDFPLDLGMAPSTNVDASLTGLFYWNNISHDMFYHYGFDEAAGNFQINNYTGSGFGNDAVVADGLDGASTNNATFGTPPDGAPGRMTMFLWVGVTVDINTPAGIAGEYLGGSAEFGPALTPTGLTGDFKLADDGVATITDGCEAFAAGFFTGLIAVIDRGNCPFTQKTKNAQDAGAIAVVIVNNQGDQTVGMGGTDPTIVIPSISVGQSDGDTFKAELPGVNGTLRRFVPDRDSGYDATVIGHEYGHGISNRLTGGPNVVGCLGNEEQGGEGWSDFIGLVMTAKAGDSRDVPRGMSAYLAFQPPDGPGIRTQPYTTDMKVNSHTYDSIKTLSIPHGVGEVWASMLWEMYWDLVDQDGFDPDLYTGTGGNNTAIQLVMDGMKLQNCSPSFTDARDAILLADQTNNGGANQCLIWEAFARRGLGVSADAGSSASRADGTEAFDAPYLCRDDLIFTDEFESGNTLAWTGTTDANGDIAINGTAALVNTLGMEITINDDDKAFLENDTAEDELGYRARFYFDPNSLTVPDGKRMKILQVFSDDPSSLRIITLVLRFQAGEFKLLLKSRTDDLVWQKIGFLSIADGPQFIEVQWNRASAPGANDGTLELFVDGVSQGQLTGLDNDGRAADRVRMGVISRPKAGTSGSVYFDAFQSHRHTTVGPVAP